METRSTKQKPRETEEQEKIQILKEEKLEEPTKSVERKKIDEKWEKNYVEFDCKMVEITEQVDNNSGHINDNCKDLKEQSKKIVDDIEEKTKILLEEELLNISRIIEVKKFDEVVRILEIHYQCGKDGNRGNTAIVDKEEIIIIILRDLIKGINFIAITKIEIVNHAKET
ncbi:hypothetical protein FQA39_LY10691 [Lamprigera yunnana]|nr:hypothetical protein FQA39_LY10691 [Lamprigera yunnana]